MSSRRFVARLAVAVAATGVLVLPATAAHAQDVGISADEHVAAVEQSTPEPSEEHTSNIGEPDAVECTGTVAVSVVDVDGAAVSGAVTTVAGQSGAGPVSVGCGEVAASLLSAPDGYAPVGATTRVARVTHGAAATIEFVVDEVEVLGVSFEREQPAAEAPAASSNEPATETLPRTGPGDTSWLLMLGALFAAAGAAFVFVGRELQPR